MTVTESDFQEAVKRPEVRQDFLNAIDLERAEPYVKRVIYKKYSFFVGNSMGPLANLRPIRSAFGVKGLKSNILVHSSAFVPCLHKNLDELKSVLIDHEGYHAEEAFRYPLKLFRKISPSEQRFLDSILNGSELRALHNQIVSFQYRKCSEYYKEWLTEIYEEYVKKKRDLFRHDPLIDLDGNRIELFV